MRRITVWLFSTVAALVLLFSYRTSTGDSAVAPAAAPVPVVTAPADPGPVATVSPSATAKAAPGGKTYQGSVAQTRWGPVQVGISVAGGRITDVAVLLYPNGNSRDQEINAYALPVLQQETLTAQSADIDTVSGATVTTDGYRESLQAALDAAHLS